MTAMGMVSIERWLAWAAMAMFCTATFAFAPGISHLHHPVALPGAVGMPGAIVFNLLAFVLPGLSSTALAWSKRARLPASATLAERLGYGLLSSSTLAFAAQGVLPLDLDDLVDRGGRWHGLAWAGWWLAFMLAQAALGLAANRPGTARLGNLALALATPALALWASAWLSPGIAQRALCLSWLGWWCQVAGRRA